MVPWRPVVAALATVLGGVLLLVGLLPIAACFGAGGTSANCTVGGPGTLAVLLVGTALFAVGNYLVYREYGVVIGGYGSRGGGPPRR